jgi:autotransporter-associated beta strand protein
MLCLLPTKSTSPHVSIRRRAQWRTWLLASAATLLAGQAWAIDVASESDWTNAAAAVAAAGAGSTVSINITAGFTLTASLAQLQASNTGVTVNITGNSQTIDGAATYQGIQVNGANALTVNISALAVANTAARGGNGENGQNGYYSAGLSYGSGGGGGGGLGAGGGLLVGSGANVTLAAVTFTNNTATGGTGGNGGVAQNAAADPVLGGNGGAGGTINNPGVTGGGGAGGAGGNTGTQGTAGAAGAVLGAGGGGGGGSGTTNSTSYTSNNAGGNGNGNAGNGRPGGDGVTNNNGSQGPGADGGSGGNGGGANGGAIYVATGGTLTILDTPISGAVATGGTGGSNGVGQGPSSINGSPGAAGTGLGAGIYLSDVLANIGVSAGNVTYANTIGGTGAAGGAINKTGAGTLTLSAVNNFTGNVNISGGTLSIGATNNLGNAANDVALSNGGILAITATTTLANGRAFSITGSGGIDVATGTTTTLQGIVGDGTSAGSLIKSGAGTLLLSATNTYTGSTTVNGGTLRAGSAAAFGASTAFAVASGATLDLNSFDRTFGALSGAGTVTGANSTISGTFTPGNGTAGSSMAITGNLAFQSGAQYLVQISPATSSLANVTGTATLGGASVNAAFDPGAYIARQYTILNATGGISGTFGALTNSNLPANFTSTLTYDASNVYLNLAMNSSAPTLNINQTNVFNALANYFNRTGGIPAVFATLTPAGLTQASGELATGSQQTTFDAMNLFMGVLTDPFIAGRGEPPVPYANAIPFADSEDALAYAATGKKRSGSEREAYAAIYRKAPPLPPVADPRWSVWAAGFGGSQTTDGNGTVGSNTATSRIYGTAVGADYRFSPYTIAGFALAGGGTNFSVNNLGSGRSDLFQAGGFVKHAVGPAYILGALAYGWQDVTTDRTLTLAGVDRLRARFDANAYSGRVEGGYRFLSPWMGIGITPYAAGQFTTFDLPSYAEQAISGANTFALSYGSKSVTASRSELGLRGDRSFVVQDGIFTLRGRAAWAHDYNTDRNVQATFQTLPGASFVVNGATPARDAALTTASAEMKWRNGFSIAGTFEGEFSDVTRSYAGKGVVRYTW